MNDIPIDHLNCWEKLWIWVENSYKNGLNLTEGGDGFSSGSKNPRYGKSPPNKGVKGLKYSLELRQKLSLAHKGMLLSEEQKKKISESMKGKNTWMKGKKMSKESSDKKRLAMQEFYKRKKECQNI